MRTPDHRADIPRERQVLVPLRIPRLPRDPLHRALDRAAALGTLAALPDHQPGPGQHQGAEDDLLLESHVRLRNLDCTTPACAWAPSRGIPPEPVLPSGTTV